MTLQCPANFLHFLQSENIGSPDGDPIRNKSHAGNVPQCHRWKYQNQYHKIWLILKEIKFYQNMIPKNPGATPQKVPKIMAHPRITTYTSYPPPPRLCRKHGIISRKVRLLWQKNSYSSVKYFQVNCILLSYVQ